MNSGIFTDNLFANDALGQDSSFDSLVSELATTGGGTPGAAGGRVTQPVDPSGGAYSPFVSGKGGATGKPAGYDTGATGYPSGSAMIPGLPASTPDPMMYGAAPTPQWVPIAVVGGAVLLTVGAVAFMMMGKKPTPNRGRRRRKTRRARR